MGGGSLVFEGDKPKKKGSKHHHHDDATTGSHTDGPDGGATLQSRQIKASGIVSSSSQEYVYPPEQRTAVKLKRTRTLLELRVGPRLLVEVVLYIRPADMAWFNDSTSSSSDGNVAEDMLEVLQTSVIPRMMHKDVEELHYKPYPKRLRPPAVGPNGIPILTGDNQGAKGHNSKQQKGSKRGTKRKANKAKDCTVNPDEDTDDKPSAVYREVYYAFGQSLQLVYKCEDISQKSKGMTLVFRNSSGSEKEDKDKYANGDGAGILTELGRLPKRIVAWIFPFDPVQPNQEDPADGGFPIPERIPMAHLFRRGTAADIAAAAAASTTMGADDVVLNP